LEGSCSGQFAGVLVAGLNSDGLVSVFMFSGRSVKESRSRVVALQGWVRTCSNGEFLSVKASDATIGVEKELV